MKILPSCQIDLCASAALAAVLGLGTYRAYTSYRTYTTRRDAARAALAQAAALDEAQREKVAGLAAAAEAALAADELETAGARIAELSQAGGAGAVAELRKRYEAEGRLAPTLTVTAEAGGRADRPRRRLRRARGTAPLRGLRLHGGLHCRSHGGRL